MKNPKKAYATLYSHINKKIKFMGYPSELSFGLLFGFLGLSAVIGPLKIVPVMFLAYVIGKQLKKNSDPKNPDVLISIQLRGSYPNIITDEENIISKL